MISFIAGGGAREIGASFYVLRFGNTYIAIDCGFRPSIDTDDPERLGKLLPDFSVCPKLDYLFLTHGHLDHVGAAPCLMKRFQNLKIVMTSPTCAIAKMQWQETLKIGEREKIAAPFSGHDLARCEAQRAEILPAEMNRECDLGDFSVKAIPAGHILGAVSFIFTYKNTKIFVSGDISFEDQETICGARVDTEADILISEATYAAKNAPARAKEKARFLADVERIANRGGRILVPAFSIGRAQEIFEMLRRSPLFKKIPVYVDGIAQRTTNLYKEYLPEKIYADVQACYVTDWEKRREILREKPCVVIASSGMLHGGKSVTYAQKWLGREENAILFPGYIDPCSPGASVLESKKEEVVTFGESNGAGSYTKRCEVQRYHFSAHADGPELLGMRERLDPRLTILVHGEAPGMEKMIEEHGKDGSIIAPANSEEIVL